MNPDVQTCLTDLEGYCAMQTPAWIAENGAEVGMVFAGLMILNSWLSTTTSAARTAAMAKKA